MFEYPDIRPLRLSGLDIGPDTVKIVELNKHKEQYHIEHTAIVPIEKQDICSAIQQAAHISGISTPYTAIAMPETDVFSQVLSINASVKPEEMEEIILVQIEPFVPWALDEIQLDFERINTSEIFVTASHRKQIEQKINLLKAAHLIPLVIDVEAYALKRAYTHLLSDLAPELTLSYGLALRGFIP